MVVFYILLRNNGIKSSLWEHLSVQMKTVDGRGISVGYLSKLDGGCESSQRLKTKFFQ